MTRWLAVVVLMTSFNAPAAEEEKTFAEVPAFYETLADKIVAAGDCAAMARDIDAWITTNDAMLSRLRRLVERGKTPPREVEARVEAAVERMTPALQRCKRDRAIEKAMGRLK